MNCELFQAYPHCGANAAITIVDKKTIVTGQAVDVDIGGISLTTASTVYIYNSRNYKGIII